MVEIKEVHEIASCRAFTSSIKRFSHMSPTLGGLETTWTAIVPDSDNEALPVIYFYSGLTCTDENFPQKAHAAVAAAEFQVIIVTCDTSPRGARAPIENDNWDFGTGAGFYVDSTAEDYKPHYQMYSFCQEELPVAVKAGLGARVDIGRASVFGHSMGGMGALVAALRNPDKYMSVSAFAPIANPINSAWGRKCFGLYLRDQEEALAYDPTELVRSGNKVSTPILIDQGATDYFLEQQLLPEKFCEACKAAGQELNYRLQEGYGHDYYFIQTFVTDHIKYHAGYLHATTQ